MNPEVTSGSCHRRPATPDPPHHRDGACLITATWEQVALWGTFVWLMMTTGVRPDEALALRWHYVHVDHAVLHVRRTCVRSRGREIEKDTKTHQMRRIGLDAETVAVLREHRQRVSDAPTMQPRRESSTRDLVGVRVYCDAITGKGGRE